MYFSKVYSQDRQYDLSPGSCAAPEPALGYGDERSLSNHEGMECGLRRQNKLCREVT